ncbi:hypothetical protein [Sphingomonas sp. SRS2]|uniref:hypothetical protein n=1 Tax=Sphingomonas sp. SRS2 TaxID=133190 RepID=UPI0006184239|nr:hypothetical protein [Sphingomonas sp. SRS2]KKC27091.1 hypothetical protein WP12_05260 [Sphingomonas sp. SRS2]
MAAKRTLKQKSVGVRLEQVELMEGARLVKTTYVLTDDRSPGTRSFTSLEAAEAEFHAAVASRE